MLTNFLLQGTYHCTIKRVRNDITLSTPVIVHDDSDNLRPIIGKQPRTHVRYIIRTVYNSLYLL